MVEPNPALPPLSAMKPGFFGREQELAELLDLLGSGYRLVTIVGPPGIGKTRLASELLSCEPVSDPRFLDLRHVTDGLPLALEVARTLGIQTRDDGSTSGDHVSEALRARGEALLVLDNAERLGEDAVNLVAGWLRRAPRLQVIVTSRRALRLETERILELSPLRVPQDTADREATALQLFRERARQVEPGFDDGGCLLVDTVRLVRRLEGIPLALELGASQMRRLTPGVLLERLGCTVLDLSSPSRDADTRHRTLRAAIGRSWEDLPTWGRDALQQLAVFRSPFSLEAAERVLDLDVHQDAPSVADVVGELREASLIRRCDADEPRWGFFESIREFAAETQADEAEIRNRHARYFLEWGEGVFRTSDGLWYGPRRIDSEPGASTGGGASTLQRDLHYAFDWFDRVGDPGRALRVALVLFEATYRLAPATADSTLSRALDLSTRSLGKQQPALVARAYLARATTGRILGRYRQAREDLRDAIGVFGNTRYWAAVINCELGRIAMEEGHTSEAQSHLEHALLDALDCKDANLEGHVRTWLAYVLHEGAGDLGNLQHYDVALDRFREGGDLRGLRTAFVYRGYAAIDFHSDADSVGQLTELLDEIRDSGDRELEVEALVAIGWGTFEQGRWAEALESFESASSIARYAGLANEATIVAISRGVALDWMGDESGAWREFTRALEFTADGRSIRWRAMIEVFLAGIYARRGRVHEAEKILARAESEAVKAGWNAIHRAAVVQRAQVDMANGVLPASGSVLDLSSDPGADGVPATLMFRYLVHCIERQQKAARGVSTELRVRVDGSSFRRGNGSWCALPRGPAIRHVLAALVNKRIEEPGVTLSRERLLEIGWPGQRVQEQAGAFRVHNVIKRLRKVGLRHAIQTDDSGYRIDPSIPVTFVPR